MKKICICILTICTLLLTCGCGRLMEFEYMHPTDKIQTIEIVEVSFGDTEEPSQTVLCTIEDIDAFIDDFEAMDCYDRFGDPLGINDGDTVIKITYNNGDYELINVMARAQCKDGKFRNYKGAYFWFDDEQFQALLDKYLSKAK